MRRSSARKNIRPPWRLLLAAGIAAALVSAGEVRAHFLWLTCERDTAAAAPLVQAFLSETPIPAGAEFLKHIEKAKITADGQTLAWSKQEETYSVSLPKRLPKMIDGFCDLGVMKRGETTFRLLYTARVQFEPLAASEPEAGDLLRARLVERAGQSPVVVVSFRGRPAAGAVVKAYPEEGDPVELKTDQKGRIDHPGVAVGAHRSAVQMDREDRPARLEGKSYTEIRHYATLTVAPDRQAAD